jgi:hypothetical protein
VTKTITKANHAFKTLLFGAELLFILVVPIYLYGWLLGLLIHSGLSSLLHIAGLQCGVFPVYKIGKEDK